jgi:hypothetical protein
MTMPPSDEMTSLPQTPATIDLPGKKNHASQTGDDSDKKNHKGKQSWLLQATTVSFLFMKLQNNQVYILT